MKKKYYYALLSLFMAAIHGLSAQTDKPFNEKAFFETFTSKTAEVNGITMHYVIGGKGPLIVLIHGWPECWYEWRKVMPLLVSNYTVISVDLRGAGQSSIAKAGYDKKTLAQDIHLLVQQLGFHDATVVGHDWGAGVGYAYAAQFPKEVNHLILCEGIPFGKWVPKIELFWFFGFFRIPGNYAEQLVRGNERTFMTYFYKTGPFLVVKDAINDADIDYYMQYFGQQERFSASLEFYRTIEQDVKDNNAWSLHPLTMPVLTIGGDHQSKNEVETVMKNVATNVRGIIMTNTGHFVPEERPVELVQVIREFLH